MRSYDGPARTRSRKFCRLSVDGLGDGVRERECPGVGVLARDDERGGVSVAIPKKLRGIVSDHDEGNVIPGKLCLFI